MSCYSFVLIRVAVINIRTLHYRLCKWRRTIEYIQRSTYPMEEWLVVAQCNSVQVWSTSSSSSISIWTSITGVLNVQPDQTIDNASSLDYWSFWIFSLNTNQTQRQRQWYRKCQNPCQSQRMPNAKDYCVKARRCQMLKTLVSSPYSANTMQCGNHGMCT